MEGCFKSFNSHFWVKEGEREEITDLFSIASPINKFLPGYWTPEFHLIIEQYKQPLHLHACCFTAMEIHTEVHTLCAANIFPPEPFFRPLLTVFFMEEEAL